MKEKKDRNREIYEVCEAFREKQRKIGKSMHGIFAELAPQVGLSRQRIRAIYYAERKK